MEKRTAGCKCRAGLVMFLVLGLAGCDTIYTIHSIAAPNTEQSTVPDLSGLWALTDTRVFWRLIDPHTSDVVLRISAKGDYIGHCRNVDIRMLGANPDEDEPIGNEICFVPLAGHLVAQLRTAGQVNLYQLALFKFDQNSVSFCEEIWADLREWTEEHPTASAVYGLEFARRKRWGWFVVDLPVTDLFITSSRNALLSFLEARLPEAAKACDKLDEEGHSGWITYVPVTPPRLPDAAKDMGTGSSPEN